MLILGHWCSGQTLLYFHSGKCQLQCENTKPPINFGTFENTFCQIETDLLFYSNQHSYLRAAAAAAAANAAPRLRGAPPPLDSSSVSQSSSSSNHSNWLHESKGGYGPHPQYGNRKVGYPPAPPPTHHHMSHTGSAASYASHQQVCYKK